MVNEEMNWTVSWFKTHEDIWQKRFEEVDEQESADGLRCYALKMSHLWKGLGEHAQRLYRAAGHAAFL